MDVPFSELDYTRTQKVEVVGFVLKQQAWILHYHLPTIPLLQLHQQRLKEKCVSRCVSFCVLCVFRLKRGPFITMTKGKRNALS